MTKRYFYTDPLAAAWMAKHFGMKLQFSTNTLEDGKRTRIQRDIYSSKSVSILENHPKLIDGRYFVHPKSLDLLGPQAGDCVEFERWYWKRKRGEDYAKDAPPRMICGWIRKNSSPNKLGGEWLGINNVGVGFDDNYLGCFEMPFRIIQRRGIAFHQPESGDA